MSVPRLLSPALALALSAATVFAQRPVPATVQ